MMNLREMSVLVLITLLSVIIPESAHSQVKGKVIDSQTSEPLMGALVQSPEHGSGTYTDESGAFSLDISPASAGHLLVSYVGFHTDSVPISAAPLVIALHNKEQETVVISGTMKPTYLSQSPIKVEVLTREFLRQIPANNVMEVIDYVNGVRQQVNCGVCGTNDIHINGMEGPYTLVLIDGMPIISALGTVYGLNGIPTSIIERIEIVKGPASTLYGAEAVAGIVNIITREPGNAPVLFLEGYGTTHGEANLDLGGSIRAGKVSGLVGANYYGMPRRLDHNEDGFTDIPLAQRLSLFNKWTLERPDHREASLAARLVTEDRFGGSLDWQPSDRGSSTVYGESIRTRRMELLGRYRLPLARVHVRLDLSYADHHQDSYYGDTYYGARQSTGFANLLWFHQAGLRHSLLSGASLKYNAYDDSTPATAETDQTILPGLFVQDEFAVRPSLTLLSGLRADFHARHGLILSPRLNMKWKPARFSTLRLTAGSGYRHVNLFTEEHAALTGAREVVIEGALAPERSYNVNANWNQVLNIGKTAVNLDADVFYTYFTNKIIPDYDQDPNQIVYRNLEGHSEIRGAAIKFSQSFTFPLRLEAGLTYMEVYAIDGEGVREDQEFAPRWDGVWRVSYRWQAARLSMDYSGRLVGTMALPEYEQPFTRPAYSRAFTQHNVLLSRDMGHGLSFQMGVRNLLNYTQPSPLINPGAPFSDSFDTAYAYGPLQQRRFTFGLRWNLDRSQEKKW